jgi:two-component system, LytTR family, sensor kinase
LIQSGMRRREQTVKRWWTSFIKTADSITGRQWGFVCKIWVSIALVLIVYNTIINFQVVNVKVFSAVELCRQTSNVLFYCLCWALTFPVFLWAARVLSESTRIDWPFVVFQAVVFIVLIAATGAARGIVNGAFYYDQYGLLKPADISNYTITFAYTGFIFYIVSLMLGYSFEYHRLFRDNAVRAAKLETQLVQSQLETLRAQLQPHFLFNTLNAIVTLMRKGETAPAIRMVGGLSDLLRQSLDAIAVQEVPLEQELAMVRKYLDIQQMRFGERLTVEYRVEPAAGPVLVPNLILQPLIENALRHGIGRMAEPGTIAISASRDGDRLRLAVANDGAGPAAGWRQHAGIGLTNTIARLEKM